MSCIIQFTRYSFARLCKPDWARRELLYVTTSLSVCQELFSNSFNFFRHGVALQFLQPSSRNLISIPQKPTFVKRIFPSFSNFFSFWHIECRPRGQLRYITIENLFCQALFHKNIGYFLYVFNKVNCLSVKDSH